MRALRMRCAARHSCTHPVNHRQHHADLPPPSTPTHTHTHRRCASNSLAGGGPHRRHATTASPLRAYTTSTTSSATAPADPQIPRQQQQQRRQLDWVSQHRAATIASWSGLCYLQSEEDLRARLNAKGMSLVASGRNDFTSWFVVDGTIDAATFAQRSLERRSPLVAAAAGAAAAAHGAATSSTTPTPTPVASPSPTSSLDDFSALCAAEAAGRQRRERFVLLRGVQWAAPEMDSAKMWRALMRVWPQPLSAAGGEIVAHDGVAEMAVVSVWGLVGGRGARRRGFVSGEGAAALNMLFCKPWGGNQHRCVLAHALLTIIKHNPLSTTAVDHV